MKQVLDSNGMKIHGVFRGVNGSLIIDDKKSYEDALIQKNRLLESSNRISALEGQIENLSSDITDIKKMLSLLVGIQNEAK